MLTRWLKPVPILIVLTVVVIVVFLRVMSLPQFFPKFRTFEDLELDTYDWRMQALYHSEPAVFGNFAGVFIDDFTIKKFNDEDKFTWPLPRQLYGRVVREAFAQGAKAVAFDILFAENHPSNELTSVKLPNGQLMASDDFFVQQINAHSNRVILAVMGDSKIIYGSNKTEQISYELIGPVSSFASHARIGHVFGQKDADGVLRRALAFTVDDSTNRMGRVWMMAAILAAVELGLDLDKADVQDDRIILNGANGVKRVLPVDHERSLPINWSMSSRHQSFKTYNFEDVVAWDRAREAGDTNGIDLAFKDKLVIVGSVGSGNNVSDRGATSVEKEALLVSKHWNVANQIITKQMITPKPLWLELALIVVMAVVGAALTWSARPWAASLLVLGVVAAYCLFARWMFVSQLYWLPIVMPCGTALLACHVATMTYRVVFEQREQRRIKGVFSKLVAPAVVKELLAAEHLELGGAQRRMTMFFADVRGFTDLTDASQARAEEHIRAKQLTGQMATDYLDEQARELLGTVNLYLSTVAGVIKSHGGTLDKYMGDCVMAFWGAPIRNDKHAASCVRAAIAAQLAIYKLNRERETENQRRAAENEKRAAAKLPILPLLPQLYLGSGINTGVVTVGLMGSDEHLFNYTVFGREVNLASRLEGVSGRGRIIIGQGTFEDLQRDDPPLAAACIPHEPIPVKGFRQPVPIYEVPWKPPDKPAPAAGAAPA